MMSQIAALKMELTHELESTKRHFEQLAGADFAWKPHEKSMSLGQLAAHCVESLAWADNMLHQDVFDFDPSSYTSPKVGNVEELLKLTAETSQIAFDALDSATDACLLEPWSMRIQGNTVMEMPKGAVFRSFILSHLIHHRGQLTVYLRLLDIPLPQTYGPSADSPQMG